MDTEEIDEDKYKKVEIVYGNSKQYNMERDYR